MGERRSLAQGQQGQWESCETGSGQPASQSQVSACEKDAARPRVNKVSGKAARREAASLLGTADRRMSKLRPGCVSAMPQSMRSLSKRQTHFDRPSEDGVQGALCPSCPTDEAINSNRQTGVQRRKRSTPNHRTGVQRAKGLSLQPPDWTEDEGLSQLRRFGPRCVRRTSVNSASAAFPRGRPGESESSSGHARATGTTHPGFYGRKPWRKPNSAVIIARPGASMRGPAGPLPQIAAKVFTKVDRDSPHSEPATSARATG